MKGLDTNVLVRFLTADDRTQSAASKKVIESFEATGERLHVSPVVLVELVWVLRGARYNLPREAIATALDGLLATEVFEIADRDLVRRAVNRYRSGPADFSDNLIGELDQRAGCVSTLTFDRTLARAEGFEGICQSGGHSSRVSEP